MVAAGEAEILEAAALVAEEAAGTTAEAGAVRTAVEFGKQKTVSGRTACSTRAAPLPSPPARGPEAVGAAAAIAAAGEDLGPVPGREVAAMKGCTENSPGRCRRAGRGRRAATTAVVRTTGAGVTTGATIVAATGTTGAGATIAAGTGTTVGTIAA